MKITNLEGGGQLRTATTELDVPHLGKTLTFMLPLIGPDYYRNVMNEIDSQELYRPTTAEVFSLVDLALQNPKERYCAEILNKFKSDYLWTATESLSFKEGVLVYDNIDGKMPETRKGLLKLLDAKDERVRLVQPGFETGDMPISRFLKHPYLIAQIGEEMIETAERVAKYFNEKRAYAFGLDKAASNTKRLTAVCSDWGDSGLVLFGSCHGSDGLGCASGVCK